MAARGAADSDGGVRTWLFVLAKEGAEEVTPTQTIVRLLFVLLLLPLGGALALMYIEQWSFIDSLYMAVITLTTVGFEEIHPLSGPGRIFVMIYLVVGIGAFFFSVVQIGEILIQVQISEVLGSRKRQSVIRSIHDHLIVCGLGRMGRRVCRKLADSGTPFVAIDRDRSALEAVPGAERWPFIAGDATDDAVLEEAGVARAKSIVAVLSSDADNLYVTLSSRLLNPNLRIIARSTDESNVVKLKRAGADRVISLYEAGANKIFQMLENPNLEDFVEILGTKSDEFDVAQFTVPDSAPYCGQELKNSGFRSDEILIVGIENSRGELRMPPDSSTVIQAGDRLFALGPTAALQRLMNS